MSTIGHIAQIISGLESQRQKIVEQEYKEQQMKTQSAMQQEQLKSMQLQNIMTEASLPLAIEQEYLKLKAMEKQAKMQDIDLQYYESIAENKAQMERFKVIHMEQELNRQAFENALERDFGNIIPTESEDEFENRMLKVMLANNKDIAEAIADGEEALNFTSDISKRIEETKKELDVTMQGYRENPTTEAGKLVRAKNDTLLDLYALATVYNDAFEQNKYNITTNAEYKFKQNNEKQKEIQNQINGVTKKFSDLTNDLFKRLSETSGAYTKEQIMELREEAKGIAIEIMAEDINILEQEFPLAMATYAQNLPKYANDAIMLLSQALTGGSIDRRPIPETFLRDMENQYNKEFGRNSATDNAGYYTQAFIDYMYDYAKTQNYDWGSFKQKFLFKQLHKLSDFVGISAAWENLPEMFGETETVYTDMAGELSEQILSGDDIKQSFKRFFRSMIDDGVRPSQDIIDEMIKIINFQEKEEESKDIPSERDEESKRLKQRYPKSNEINIIYE